MEGEEDIDWVNANVPLAPRRFYDPISGGVLDQPVRAEDGRIYSRSSIEARFAQDAATGRDTVSPATGEPMGTALTAATEIEAELDAFRQTYAGRSVGADGDSTSGVQSLKQLGVIFSQLDRLRDILATTLEGWQPPQLVVVGSESAGKSTLLGRLTMMPIFPTHDQLCTRLPIHVRLRRCSAPRAPRLEVYDSSTGATLEGPWEIPMGSGHREILAKMEELVWGEDNLGRGVHTERSLIVHVDSPSVPSLDLVDLPGLVQSPPDMAAATDALVRRYITAHNTHSIFLAVVPATSKPNDSKALALLQQYAVDDRTIGVLTMCDELPARKVERLRERMEEAPAEALADPAALTTWLAAPVMGDSVRLRHGYVATANEPLSLGDVAKYSSAGDVLESPYDILHEQAAGEVAWFEGAGMGDLLTTGRAGCNALVGRINGLFLDYIRCSWVPVTIFKLKQERQQLAFLNAALGLPEAGCNDVAGGTGAGREEVRRLAVEAASETLLSAVPRLMQLYMRQLEALRHRLLDCVGSELRMLPEEMESRWFGLAEAVMTECAAFVGEAESFWGNVVRSELNRRRPQPGWPSAAACAMLRPEGAMFQLSRFPRFIEAVMAGLARCVQVEQRESIVAAVDAYLGRFFDELLPNPAVSITPDFASSPATVVVRCDHAALADTILLIFLRHGAQLLREWLLPVLEEAAAGVTNWQEGCAAERDALKQRASDVESALERVEHLLTPSAGPDPSDGQEERERETGRADLHSVSIAHCEVSGECVERGVVVAGQSAEFIILGRDFSGRPLTAGGLPFVVSIYGAADGGEQGETTPEKDKAAVESAMVGGEAVFDSSDGVYKLSLPIPGPSASQPLSQSAVSVSVELHNTPVAGSPFQLALTHVSAEACTACGEGLVVTEPGRRSVFEVQATGVDGSVAAVEGAPFEVTVRVVDVESGEEEEAVEAEVEVKGTDDGRYVVSYALGEAERVEEVDVAVRLYGRHIRGSPFAVRVKLRPLGLQAGVLHDFPLAALEEEWVCCYDQPYSHATMTEHFPLVGEWLFVCAVLEGGDRAALGAFGQRTEVMMDHTGSDSLARAHHGAYWYWRPHRAVGFASSAKISLNHADTCDEDAVDRLSWHFHQSGNGGWRVGDVTGLDKDPKAWRKRVYVWPASALSPTSPAVAGGGGPTPPSKKTLRNKNTRRKVLEGIWGGGR